MSVVVPASSACNDVLGYVGGAGHYGAEPSGWPTPGPGEVLIRVKAIGVNRLDLELAKEADAPPILGLEASGTVVAAGDGVSGFPVGARVMTLVNAGAYADYVVAPAATTLPMPERLSFEEAAAVPEAYFTIWSNVFVAGRLKAGETILIHGGTSGVGSAAVQLAHARGARVITTARTREKCEAARRLGADLAIPYAETDFEEEVRRFTGGEGVDVVLDLVGADYLERNIRLLKRGGRLVLIDSRSGDWGRIDLGSLIGRNLVVTGSVLRPRPLSEKAEIARGVQEHLLPLLADGRVRPLVYRTLPLSALAEAHALMVRSDHIGKIVLVPR